MVLDTVGFMMSADAQPSTREKVIAYVALCGIRLGLVAVVFLLAWVSTWVEVGTAGLIAGLLTVVVLGATMYEVFVSRKDRASLSYVLITSLAVAAAIVLPLVGSAQFWPALTSTLIGAGLLTVFRKRIVSSGK